MAYCLEGKARRPLPSGLGAPGTDPDTLQPPPRQRAVWALRELLEFSAAEVAEVDSPLLAPALDELDERHPS